MKVLITGGKGYIARNLVPLFEKGGYEVVAPSRTEMDLLNEEQTREVLLREQPNVLIHAAARGGNRNRKDTWEEVFIPNMKMWETIQNICLQPDINIEKILLIGSGAEFDRRNPIHDAMEGEQKYATPLDPYGLSKNLITRNALDGFEHTCVLRLFGCFNWDDDPARFIKAGILNLKRGLPIQIHQNREMSYFFLDDVYTVMDYIIKQKHMNVRHINLVYPEKTSLIEIAALIYKYASKADIGISVGAMGDAPAYSGAGDVLASLPIELIGLEGGIRQTVFKLT